MTSKNDFYAMIMAGGRGERFWPVSRASHPKQFVKIFGGKPLITIAVERLQGLVAPERILIVTSADLVDISRQSLPMLPPENVIGEPFGRDTAAACALGAAWVAHKGGDSSTMVVLTADHLIEDIPVFLRTLEDGAEVVAQEASIGVIGIVPKFPATGYGYIDAGEALDTKTKTHFMRVKRFVEKPNIETAAKYVESGHHYWNSGMFLWRISTFKDALAKFQPQLLEMATRMEQKFGSDDFQKAMLDEYEKLDRISVDYAIMEKADNIISARCSFGWDDVGTWVSAADHLSRDASGNSTHGLCEVRDAGGNTVVNDVDGHLVAVMGLDDVVVVHTADATLVCSRASAPRLKEMVKQVAEHGGAKFTE